MSRLGIIAVATLAASSVVDGDAAEIEARSFSFQKGTNAASVTIVGPGEVTVSEEAGGGIRIEQTGAGNRVMIIQRSSELDDNK
ncbi:MAG: hypothetical protein ACSHXI_11430 [Hoeflea sp.]|uniref:hypothetical protein n=1 Tax=Hoeflea sp. TaxID=1940281 RepID=UPI003EF19183